MVTVIALALSFSTGPFWSKVWAIFTAVLKPIIIGGIICYLLLPVVNRFERLFNRTKKHKWARAAGVGLTFAIIAALIIFVLAMIVVSIYKNVEALNVDSLTNLFSNFGEQYKELGLKPAYHNGSESCGGRHREFPVRLIVRRHFCCLFPAGRKEQHRLILGPCIPPDLR